MTHPDPVPVTVTFTKELTPRARRITFKGMTVVESVKPASYLSLYFEDPQNDQPSEPDSPRRNERNYTPRYLDPECHSMTVDFVLHGSGRAAEWAHTAKAGDTIWASPTTGGYDIPDDVHHLVLAGDDTAIPAIGTILEAIPRDTRTTVIIEVVNDDDEREPSDDVPSDPIWLHRGTDVATAGFQTLNLVKSIAVPPDAHWWIAGERDAITSVRDVLTEDRGIAKDRISLNAYWRLRPDNAETQ